MSIFLQERAKQYKYWSLSGEPLVMWLSGLHIPESYLTALVQVSIILPSVKQGIFCTNSVMMAGLIERQLLHHYCTVLSVLMKTEQARLKIK